MNKKNVNLSKKKERTETRLIPSIIPPLDDFYHSNRYNPPLNVKKFGMILMVKGHLSVVTDELVIFLTGQFFLLV